MSVICPTAPVFDSGSARRSRGSMISILGTVGLIAVVSILVWSNREPAGESAKESRVACRAIFTWREGPVFSVAWSPDGRKLASSGFSPVVRVWEPATGKVSSIESDSGQPRFVLGWSADGSALIAGGLDVPVESWDLSDGPEGGRIAGRPVDLPKSGQALIEAGRGGTIRLWGPMDRRLDLLPPSGRAANSFAYSPDGLSIASGGCDGTFRVWDRPSGSERLQLRGDVRGINSVAFSPDSRKIATGGGGPGADLGRQHRSRIDQAGPSRGRFGRRGVVARRSTAGPGLLGRHDPDLGHLDRSGAGEDPRPRRPGPRPGVVPRRENPGLRGL